MNIIKKFATCSLLLLSAKLLFAQNVGINADNSNPDNSAILDIKSVNKGMLVPRMTMQQMNTITSPALGLLIFNTDTKSFWFYDSNTWVDLTAGAWRINGNAGTDPVNNFLGTTDDNALSFRVNNNLRMRLDQKGRLYLWSNDTTNTMVGLSAGSFNTGSANSFFGNGAGALNTTGINNSYFGQACGSSNSSGNNNSFLGQGAGYNNLSGSNNTGIGMRVLFNNNAGIDNVAVGYQALYSNTFGNANTAVGQQSLFNNTDGNDNVAIGQNALTNYLGSSSTAVGNNAGRNNSTGGPNSFFGYNCGQANTIGGGNSYFGLNAGFANISGNNNSIFGSQAGENAAIANDNSFFGYQAGQSQVSGDKNSFFGFHAGNGNLTGRENTFIGSSAGDQNLDGIKNVCIGAGSDVQSSNLTNAVAIGHDAIAIATGAIQLGNSSTTGLYCKFDVTATSDARIKTCIQENVPGITFIEKLRPVTYRFDIDRENELRCHNDTSGWVGKYDIEKTTYSGFLAQEVELAAQSIGYNFSGVVVPSTDKSLYGLRYAEFTVPLVKAVQEQQTIIENQKTEITALKTQLDSMQQQMQTLLGEVQAIKASIIKQEDGK